jgi:hypothetical protein
VVRICLAHPQIQYLSSPINAAGPIDWFWGGLYLLVAPLRPSPTAAYTLPAFYGSIVDRSNPAFVSISEENVSLARVRRFDCLRASRTNRPSFEGIKGVFLELSPGNKDSISGAMDT